MAHDVFISHSAKDKSVANAICAVLESRGVRCWIAPRDVLPGMSWPEAIVDAIEASRVMVLVFSAHANESKQVIREMEQAQANDLALLPVRIQDVEPTKSFRYFLGTAHWLDATTPPMEPHLNWLAESVSRLLRPPMGGRPSGKHQPAAAADGSAGGDPSASSPSSPVRGHDAGAGSQPRTHRASESARSPDAGRPNEAAGPDAAARAPGPARQADCGGESGKAGAGTTVAGAAGSSAAVDFAASLYGIGLRYANGQRGFPRDVLRAVEYFRNAANLGYSMAMYRLGTLFSEGGNGLTQDEAAAVQWFRRAIEAGHVKAMTRLGTLYARGRGGLPQDDTMAVRWFQKAADAGEATAMLNLGIMYEDGRGGLPRDGARSLGWYRKAAAVGDETAKQRLKARGLTS